MINFVVREPFGDYAKGQIVSESDEVALLAADPHRANSLIRIEVPDASPSKSPDAN